MPPGYRFRPVRDEDADTVAAFANEETEALIGTRVYSAEWLLREWTAPTMSRERDLAVVESPCGEVCGYLGIGAEPPFVEVFARGIVALPHHGLGIGAAILAECERRAHGYLPLTEPDQRVVLHADTLVDVPRASALMAAGGYREVRRFLLMRIDFEGEPEAPRAVPGIDIRTLRPEVDARPVFEAEREAFADHWGTGEPTFEDFCHYVLSGPSFDPSLCFVAWAGDEVAGYMLAIEESEEDPSRGYARALGVRRAYRRRGIAEALVRRLFLAFYERGKAGCDLHVDAESETGATRIYQRVGMTPYPRFATWEKELRPGGP